MSTRYSLSGTEEYGFNIAGVIIRSAGWTPRFNVSPSQQMPVIVSDNGQPVERAMRWGIIPAKAKAIPGTREPHVPSPMITARRETLTSSPAWSKLFTARRCLVPADGFFEWEQTGSTRHPWRFAMKDGTPFLIAGLWDRWLRPPPPGAAKGKSDDGDGDPARMLDSFAMVTTAPNDLVMKIHDRMPAILSPAHYQAWLNSDDLESLTHLPLEPFPAVHMDSYRANPIVNNPQIDSPDCIKPQF